MVVMLNEPPDINEPDETDLEAFEQCAYSAICERIYKDHIDAQELPGYLDTMAETLGCTACPNWEPLQHTAYVVARNEDGAKRRICSKCKHEVDKSDHYCHQCGAMLT